MPVKPFGITERLRSIMAANGDAHDHRRGHLECPICKLHDHDSNGEHPSGCRRCHLLGEALME